jgi:hypothetical protein
VLSLPLLNLRGMVRACMVPKSVQEGMKRLTICDDLPIDRNAPSVQLPLKLGAGRSDPNPKFLRDPGVHPEESLTAAADGPNQAAFPQAGTPQRSAVVIVGRYCPADARSSQSVSWQ